MSEVPERGRPETMMISEFMRAIRLRLAGKRALPDI